MPIPIQEEESDSDVVKVSPRSITPPSSSEIDEKPRIEMDEKPKIRSKVEDMSAEELDAHIEATINKFRARTERARAAAWPYAQKLLDFSNRRPVLFTFLAIFGALSTIPIGIFVGFLATALIVIVGTAAVGICLTTLTCILIATSVLLPVLIFTAVVSTFILSCLIALFLAHRFYLHLKAASTSPEGSFTPSVDSILSASVDFGIETASRVGIEIHPSSFSDRDGKTDFSVSALIKRVRWDDGEWTDASGNTVDEKGHAEIDPAPAPAQAQSGQTVTTSDGDDLETPTVKRLAMQRLAQQVEARRALGVLTDTAALEELDAFFGPGQVRQ